MQEETQINQNKMLMNKTVNKRMVMQYLLKISSIKECHDSHWNWLSWDAFSSQTFLQSPRRDRERIGVTQVPDTCWAYSRHWQSPPPLWIQGISLCKPSHQHKDAFLLESLFLHMGREFNSPIWYYTNNYCCEQLYIVNHYIVNSSFCGLHIFRMLIGWA